MKKPRDKNIGLVGGSIERRVAESRIPPVDHPYVLAPFRVQGDKDAFAAFVKDAPLQVEIGFGRAHHLLDLATQASGDHILGFETRRQWCKQASTRASKRGLGNVRVVEGDARPFLERLVGDGAIGCIHILFPDPWWKRRHHKRRVFSQTWLELLWRLLEPGGSLVAKTDVPAYADLMERQVTEHSRFQLVGEHAGDALLHALPRSHREKKCAGHDIPVYAFHFVKEIE